MRYAKEHKSETREQLIQIASKLFRKDGIEKVGVASLMAGAGMTVGGFYRHFKSKDDLIKQAVLSAADETFCSIFSSTTEGKKNGLAYVLKIYLSPEHRDNPKSGCVVAALASELKNASPGIRTAIAEKSERFVGAIEELLPTGTSLNTRKRTANAIWGLMIGTLQMSRIITQKEASDQILRDGIANALKLANGNVTEQMA